MAKRTSGTVKWFNSERGYGFIKTPDGLDVFVHYTAIRGTGYRSLNDGEVVEFVVEESKKGLQAVDVSSQKSSPKSEVASLLKKIDFHLESIYDNEQALILVDELFVSLYAYLMCYQPQAEYLQIVGNNDETEILETIDQILEDIDKNNGTDINEMTEIVEQVKLLIQRDAKQSLDLIDFASVKNENLLTKLRVPSRKEDTKSMQTTGKQILRVRRRTPDTDNLKIIH